MSNLLVDISKRDQTVGTRTGELNSRVLLGKATLRDSIEALSIEDIEDLDFYVFSKLQPDFTFTHLANQMLCNSFNKYTPAIQTSITNISSFYSNSKIKQLTNEFFVEYKKHSGLLKINELVATEIFEDLAREVAIIDFVDSRVEISAMNSIRIKLQLENKNLLVINKPVGIVEDLKNSEVIFSLFEENDLLLSGTADIHKLAISINEYSSTVYN